MVNMHEAKTHLSKLVEQIESGEVTEVILARNGRPVARLVPLDDKAAKVSRRIGIAKGMFPDCDFAPDPELDRLIAEDFYK